LDSSVLVTVPSFDWVTVFSVDLTVPSLLTLLLSVRETSRSHPTSRKDNAKADVATHITAIRFIIICFIGDTSKLRTCHDAPRWPAAHNQREAATVENPTSAPPVTICEASGSSDGRPVASRRKSSGVPSGPRPACKVHGAAVVVVQVAIPVRPSPVAKGDRKHLN